MFKFHIRGENIALTDAIREYAEKKVSKLDKYFENTENTTAHVNVRVYPNKKAKAEVTIPLPGLILRAEETTDDLYGSIDLVVDKLERQVRKYKTRIHRRTRQQVPVSEDVDETLRIVRTKHIEVKPMDIEEAILQMELSGHDFYVFKDAKTNETRLVYRRHDGKYGLLETDI